MKHGAFHRSAFARKMFETFGVIVHKLRYCAQVVAPCGQGSGSLQIVRRSTASMIVFPNARLCVLRLEETLNQDGGNFLRTGVRVISVL